MVFVNRVIKQVLGSRLRAMDNIRLNGEEVQADQFKLITEQESETNYFKKCKIGSNSTYADFKNSFPIISYEDISLDIQNAINKNHNFVTSQPIEWVAKSSGTTNDTSKYVPINKRYLWNCHYQGAKDVMVTVVDNHPNTKAYSGLSLTLGGSQSVIENSNIMVGDLSAILISNTPKIVELMRAPERSIALMSSFDNKIEAICKTCIQKNITSFAGVPSWNLVLMKKILDYTGKSNILEVWGNMSLFMHGGVAFTPYKKQFGTIFPSDQMDYIETYNASEGFFAIQDTLDPSDGMLLMLDYGIFYEFLPVDKLNEHSCAVPLSGVQKGIVYAMIITNNSGLVRYLIGDTIEFTSINPYRIKITGRTKQFINAFGEEVMVGNTDGALIEACRVCNAQVNDYTLAPIFMNEHAKGAHEWVVEFEVEPTDIEKFRQTLDLALQELNSDYKAKRANNATMECLKLHAAPKGIFEVWMTKRGKQGGQNKVPRLSSDRKFVESILELF